MKYKYTQCSDWHTDNLEACQFCVGFLRLAHKSISNSERRAAKPRAAKSTCLPCRDLNLIKDSGAKINAINY